jgi:hypothetical protein
MKDLYLQLGIAPTSAIEEITAALESKPELSDCSRILLDEDRRAGYDEGHHTLKTIGVLRQRLGLDTGHSWFLENHPDFSLRKSPAFSPPPAQPRQASPAPPPPSAGRSKPAADPNRRMTLIFGLIGLIAVLLVVAYFML